MKVFMVRLSIFFTLLGWAMSQSCTVPDTDLSEFHAGARVVPYPQVDPELKREFLHLFNRARQGSSARDARNASETRPIDPAIVDEINSLCGQNDFFYSFAPRHSEAVELLQQVFLDQPTAQDVLRVAREQLDRHEINVRIWYYALTAALTMHPALIGYIAAFEMDASPDLYIPWTVLRQAIHGNNPQGTCIPSNGTRGATSEPENRVWYFLEDIQNGQTHWYWHLYNPQFAPTYHPDRVGELFLFYHHNIIARYNAERLANGLDIHETLDFRRNGLIPVGYNPDLREMISGKMWTPRDANTRLRDILHTDDPDIMMDIDLRNISRLHSMIRQHIDRGVLIANMSLQEGRQSYEFLLDIRDQPGLEHLSETIDATIRSVNPALYHPAGIHSLAHIAVAFSKDPNYTLKLPPGVVGTFSATMRDPAFYHVHTFADHLYDRYKGTLPPYQVAGGEWPLIWPGVRLVSLGVTGQSRRRNVVNTFMEVKQFPLEGGIDGTIHNGSVDVNICQKQINHSPFTFRLEVDIDSCWQSRSRRGTVRIFMAPRQRLNGRRIWLPQQRTLMFQMDAFQVDLQPGRNIITRNSADNAVSTPWTRSLQEMLRDPSNGGRIEQCGCGWPENLYIPKGTHRGFHYDLFAIITNYDEDHFENPEEMLRNREPCGSPWVLCGIPNRMYPDARPMGYPFDRLPYSINSRGSLRQVNSVTEYVSHIPNAASTVLTVRHTES